MNMNVRPASLASLVALVALTTTRIASATEPAPEPIAVGEIATESSGMDLSSLRETAEAEVRQIDTSKLALKRRYVVSFSLTRASITDAVSCKANAILRD